MKIANQLTELIGTTPLLSLERYSRDAGLDMPLVAKLEMRNPGGSAKDRAALSMIASALSEGKLQPGGTIIEPTSGNMGVALAWIASAMGLKTIIVMLFRLALIKAIFPSENPFLVLDDPFMSLDATNFDKMRDFIKLISEHFQVLYLTCHKARLLEGGKL